MPSGGRGTLRAPLRPFPLTQRCEGGASVEEP